MVTFTENYCVQYVNPLVPGKDASLATAETWPYQTMSCFQVYGLLIIAFLVIFITANREVSARPQRKPRESMSVKGSYFWRVRHPIPGEALISYRVPLRDHQRGHLPPVQDNKKELRWPKDKHLLYLWNVIFSAKYLMSQNTYLSKNNLNPSSTL